jgi:hypothetical protein
MAKRRREWSDFTVDEKLEALRADANVALEASNETARAVERCAQGVGWDCYRGDNGTGRPV